MNHPAQSPLGKASAYADQYDPALLFPIARAPKRAEIGITGTQPFFGADLWTAFELSWLNARGKPQVALAHVTVPCETPNIIESKSFKLYLNSFNGTRFDSSEAVRERLRTEVEQLRSQVADLMQAAVNISAEALSPATQEEQVVIAGQSNLLAVSDFSHDMYNLRRAFDLFEQKTQILRLLDFSSQAEGVRIFIGGESHIVPIEELSVVSAPYEVDGQIVGTLGVIGPTRMPYDKMIQIVDITSKLVSNALSHQR